MLHADISESCPASLSVASGVRNAMGYGVGLQIRRYRAVETLSVDGSPWRIAFHPASPTARGGRVYFSAGGN